MNCVPVRAMIVYLFGSRPPHPSPRRATSGPLLDQVPGSVSSLTGDGAYDRTRVYAAVQEAHPGVRVVASPRCNAVLVRFPAGGTSRLLPANRLDRGPRRGRAIDQLAM